MKLSSDIFAAQGYKWNTPNYQKPAGIIIRDVRGPNWHELTHEWEIEGYGPDGEPTKAQARVREPVKVNPVPMRVPVPGEKRSLPPEGEHFHRREEIRGKAKPLTEAQKVLRKKQRAQVKARLTRAENRRKRERQEVMNILLSL